MKKIFNVLLIILVTITVLLTGYAVMTGGTDAAISLNLMWGYFLFVFAVAAAVFCALFGMIQSPAGTKSAIAAFVLILVVIGASYFIAAGHTTNIANLADGGFFSRGETVITETCILVTYVAFVAAFVTALVTEVWGALK